MNSEEKEIFRRKTLIRFLEIEIDFNAANFYYLSINQTKVVREYLESELNSQKLQLKFIEDSKKFLSTLED